MSTTATTNITAAGADLYGVNQQTAQQVGAKQDLASQDVFIELLMAQMQHQDPLDPIDNQQFVTQLAQLSTVEQLRSVNSNLEMLQLYQSSINNAQAVTMIGKQIKAAGDSCTLSSSGGDAELSFNLAADAATVKVNISDANGNPVRSLDLSNLKKGDQTVTWNGLNSDGSPMDAGEYTFSVSATDTEGTPVTAETFISGVVDGVTFESGVPMLHIGDHKVSMGEIYEVTQER